MRIQSFFSILALAVLLAACAGPGVPQAGGKVAASEAQRDLDPQVPEADLAAAVAANQEFSTTLYQALRSEPGNLFFSPYSIQTALAMTYAGARGETESQMAEALRFSLPQERLHPAMNRLDLSLGATGLPAGEAKEGEERPFSLNIANSLWAEQTFEFLPAFLDLLARNYAAGLRLVDFKTAPEPARVQINDWVADETNDRIRDLIPPEAINPDTRLVLANAIYFLADWQSPFEAENTQPQDFYPLEGGPVQVEMMNAEAETRLYTAGEGYQAVALPYRGRPEAEQQFAMLFVVPDTGAFESVEAGLDAAQLQSILQGLAYTDVILGVPKFEFEQQFSLVEQLAALGMPVAFDRFQADFSGMTGQPDLVISDVIHKAFVAVDEKGTEAAAATAVIMELAMAAPPPEAPIELILDRPFLFFIVEQQSGVVLFAGRYASP